MRPAPAVIGAGTHLQCCVYTFIVLCVYTGKHVRACSVVYVYMYKHKEVHMHINIYIYEHIYIYIYMYIYVCIYIHICI